VLTVRGRNSRSPRLSLRGNLVADKQQVYAFGICLSCRLLMVLVMVDVARGSRLGAWLKA
ncbi:hypothetical protein Tco_1323863, partial [Tanacetum coccineum]